MMILFCDECTNEAYREILENEKGDWVEVYSLWKGNTLEIHDLLSLSDETKRNGWEYITLPTGHYWFCPECYKDYKNDSEFYQARELIKLHLDHSDLAVWKMGLGLYLIEFIPPPANKFNYKPAWHLLEDECKRKKWSTELFKEIKHAIAIVLPKCDNWGPWAQFNKKEQDMIRKAAVAFLGESVELPFGKGWGNDVKEDQT